MPTENQSSFLDNDETDEQGNEAPTIEELQAKLKQTNDLLAKEQAEHAKLNQTLQSLATDPDVVRVVSMKQKGEQVSFGNQLNQNQPPVDAAEKLYMQVQSGEVSIDDLSQSQLLTYMTQSTDKRVEQTLKKVLEPISQKIQSFDQERIQNQVTGMQTQLQQVQAKYRDFDSIRPQMVEVAKQNPSLGIEDIYLLTKGRLGSPIAPNVQMDTERPDQRAVSIAAPKSQQKKPVSQTRDWSSLLEDTFSRMNIPNLGE